MNAARDADVYRRRVALAAHTPIEQAVWLLGLMAMTAAALGKFVYFDPHYPDQPGGDWPSEDA